MAEYNLGTATGRITLDASGAVRGAATANAALDGVDKQARSTRQSTDALGKGLSSIGVAASAGIGLAVKVAAGFEQRLSGVAAVSGATERQMEAVRRKALQLGADTVFSASEAASAFEELTKAGISLDDSINGAADAVVALAAAGEIDLAKAATIASAAMNNFRLTGAEMPHVADLIAGAANASAITVEEFGHSLQQSGAAAALAGFSFDDLAVAIAVMGNAGIRGSDAGTSLRVMFTRLTPETKKAKDMMRDLGLITEEQGNRFFDAEGNVKSLAEVSQILQDSLAGMTSEQKQTTLELLFGQDALRAAAVLSRDGSAGFNEMAASMGKVSAEDVAEKRLDNLAGSLEFLKGSVETAAIVLGEFFIPAIRRMADALSAAVDGFLLLTDQQQRWVATGLSSVAIFGTLAGGLLLVVPRLLDAARGFSVVTATVGGLITGPMLVAAGVIAALAGAFYLAYTRSEVFRDVVDRALGVVRRAFETLMAAVDPFIRAFGAALRGDVEETINQFFRIPEPLQGVANLLLQTLVPAMQDLQRVFGTIVDAIGPFIDLIVNHLQGNVEGVGTAFGKLPQPMREMARALIDIIERVKEFVAEIRERLGPVIETVRENFRTWVEAVVGYISTLYESAKPTIESLTELFRTAFDLIRVVVEQVVAFITNLWDNGFFRVLLQAAEMWLGTLVATFQRVFNGIMQFLDGIFKIISGLLNIFIGIFTGDWDKFLKGVDQLFVGVWNVIAGFFRVVLGVLRGILETAIIAIVGAWNLFLATVKAAWETAWNGISNFFGAILRNMTDTVAGWQRSFREMLVSWGNGISDFWTDLWQGVETWFVERFNSITSFFRGWRDTAVGLFEELGRRIKTPIFNAINWIINNLWNNGIRNLWEKANDLLPALPDPPARIAEVALRSGGRVPGRGFGDRVPLLGEPGEFMIRKSAVARYGQGFFEALNAQKLRVGGAVQGVNANLIGALTKWSDTLGFFVNVISGKRNLAQQQALYARYLRGEGPLAARPTPNAPHVRGDAVDIAPGPGRRDTAQGRRAGEFGLGFPVRSEDWHMQLLRGGGGGGGGGIGGGIGGVIGGVVDWFRGQAANLIDTVAGPLKGLIDSTVGQWGFPGQALGAVGHSIIDAAVDFIRGKAGEEDSKQISGPLEKSPTGTVQGLPGAVTRWTATVHRALGIVGQPLTHTYATLRRLMQESGGNPLAINRTDINAQRGDPSRGLMQTIMATFTRYRLPGLSGNIYDPLSNIVASMRYALARYGSLPAAYNKRGGYDRGGILPPGLTMALNNTGQNEYVFTKRQLGGLMDADKLVAQLTTQLAAQGPAVQVGQVYGYLPGDLEREIDRALRRRAVHG